MATSKRSTSSALSYLDRRYFEGKPQRLAELADARASAAVARQIYDLRTKAGLTQQKLAKLVGTTHSVISRLEDDDYEGHSLSMLRRIAEALESTVEVRFVPRHAKRQAPTSTAR